MNLAGMAGLVAALALAGCQTSAPPAATSAGNQSLLDAGFVAKTPGGDSQSAAYAILPPNRMVKQTVKGKVTYLYSDPAGCGCVYVGTPQSFRNYGAMQNTMMVMTRQQPGAMNQIDPGLTINGIEDLDSWSPL